MNLKSIKIHNWMLSLNKISPFFINKELYEKMTERYFINNYSDTIYLMGEYRENIQSNQTFFALTTPVRLLSNNIVISENGTRIILGEKSSEYQHFENAVSNNIPIIYNWVIGVNEQKLQEYRTQIKVNSLEEKELYISCNMIQNGQISYIKDKIIEQNIEESSITLKKMGKVFISWGAKNTYHSLALKKSEETIIYLYDEATEKLEYKKHQLKNNLKNLNNILNNINNYTQEQLEDAKVKEDQLLTSNKRIIKIIQKNEEKVNLIFNEIKRLRTINLNIHKGSSIDLSNNYDLLTKNINIRIKFFENPKDIDIDLESKEIGKLFKKRYVYLKKGTKN